ncbi:MAG: hypothetical protein K2G32_08825 [Oscillospiraceae bacterium]|nr:hypothetical protein [Oscillospiraceae bacterium]
MKLSTVAIICAAAALVGAVCTAYQMFVIVKADAEARGLKHPKLWGMFALSGNNSAGLLLYLITRRKHPVVNMTAERQHRIDVGKKRALAGIVFLAVGAIGVVVALTLGEAPI